MPTQLQSYNPINTTPVQADTDEGMISLWLNSKSENTKEAYSRDINKFIKYINKPLKDIILADLQGYGDKLKKDNLKERTQQRELACIKSLFSFASSLRYLMFDVGKAMKLPKHKDDLAQRILSHEDILHIVYNEKNVRNQLFLKALYLLGGRVSEVINLKWSDIIESENKDSVVVTLFGKGSKTRNILLSRDIYRQLLQLGKDNGYIFKSKKTKKQMTRQQAYRIVKRSASRVIQDKNISPHWFRHAHASHALEKGVSMALIQRDLGHSSLAITGRYLHARPTDGSGLQLSI